MASDNFFWVSNRGCAATLVLKGFELVKVAMRPNKKTGKESPQFAFEKTDDIRDTAGAYWDSRLTVDPKEFNDKLFELNAQVRSL